MGFITDNKAFLGFFGFLIYFRYFTIIPDELFKDNVKKAATPAFFISVTVTAMTIVLTAIIKLNLILSMGLIISFIVSMIVFTILLMTYEYIESRQD
ncbi:hypothetical protein Clo1100_0232 [Clostridium sp. BNL1100]|nr:hypothetical protein Clo1100_0232 [Clostridium sp. BNL1100]